MTSAPPWRRFLFQLTLNDTQLLFSEIFFFNISEVGNMKIILKQRENKKVNFLNFWNCQSLSGSITDLTINWLSWAKHGAPSKSYCLTVTNGQSQGFSIYFLFYSKFSCCSRVGPTLGNYKLLRKIKSQGSTRKS